MVIRCQDGYYGGLVRYKCILSHNLGASAERRDTATAILRRDLNTTSPTKYCGPWPREKWKTENYLTETCIYVGAGVASVGNAQPANVSR